MTEQDDADEARLQDATASGAGRAPSGTGGPGGPDHNMGGRTGAASIRGSNAPLDESADSAAPSSGFAVPADVAADDPTPNVSGPDDATPSIGRSGQSSVAADTSPDSEPSDGPELLEMPEDRQTGLGADGSWEARKAQKDVGGP